MENCFFWGMFGSHKFQSSSTTIYVSLSSIRVLQGNLFSLGEASDGPQSNLLFKARPEIGSDQLFTSLWKLSCKVPGMVTAQPVLLLDYPHGEVVFSFLCTILHLLNVSNDFMIYYTIPRIIINDLKVNHN